ncbi:hypothetical protein [Lederbergia lenta]|uniref:Uncharacterized protein n=1 Tax=Lederbergia lenta TaxID=1467 RepID=A0A2X4VPU8_LEDLE|nr:hypothetical protein [Lederbergia lenta]MEC2326621.1 hypothetical protein [Lederbergia lenta]SQI53013.1 Uncharacterised protein [Lederbergia lenta]
MGDKELIDAFEQSEINLLVELRMGNGLHEKEYENVVEALSICADEWKSRNSIPKKAILALSELYGDLYNFSLIYADVESARIKEAAENIKTLIRGCTIEKGEMEPEKARVIARLCEYIKEDGNFFKKLQNGKGFDEQQFEKIYHELDNIYEEIYSWEAFPKELINIFIDLYELDLFVYQYRDEEADKIYDAYERIFSLIFG